MILQLPRLQAKNILEGDVLYAYQDGLQVLVTSKISSKYHITVLDERFGDELEFNKDEYLMDYLVLRDVEVMFE